MGRYCGLVNDTSPSRYVVVVTHATRDDAFDAAAEFISEMAGRDIGCAVPDDQAKPMSSKLPGIDLESLGEFAHEASSLAATARSCELLNGHYLATFP